MKLPDVLTSFPADNAIILTYNLDLLYFEYMVFEPLYMAGCHNVLLMPDPAQYAAALSDMPELRFAGQQYVISPGRTSPQGAFHPKLILLTSPEQGLLLLTSANLTRPGYAYNLEVVTSFRYDHKHPDEISLRALHWAFQTIQQIIERSDDPLARERLEQVWQTTPWLQQESPEPPPDSDVWLFHNLDQPLLSQFDDLYRAWDGSDVTEAIIISPYFDKSLQALAQVKRHFKPQQWRIFTQDAVRALNKPAWENLFGHADDTAQLFELEIENNRRLHAKTIALRTGQGVCLMTGSANATAPALLLPAHRGNTELISLRYEPDPHYFDDWLNVLISQAHPVDIATLSAPDDIPNQKTSHDSTPGLIFARLQDDQICIQTSSPLPDDASWRVRVYQGDRIETIDKPWQQCSSTEWCLSESNLPGIDWQAPILMELVTDEAREGARVVLHNHHNLTRSSRPVRRKDRPQIPPDLLAADDEQSLRIMELLQELLATNRDLLQKHRGPIASRARLREEASLSIEEEYDPEAYIVDEVIRAPVGIEEDANIYSDYFNRLTFEEILKALRAAVIPLTAPASHPAEPPHSDATMPVETPQPSASDTPSISDEELREKALARLRSGLARLIADFQKSKTDETYLEAIPPAYAAKLFFVLLVYLTNLWKKGLVDNAFFVQQAQILLQTFWGDLGEPGMWDSLKETLSDQDSVALIAQWQLHHRTWFTLFLLARLLESSQNIYPLAAWMRYFSQKEAPPQVLLAFDAQQWEKWWAYHAPQDWEIWPSEKVVDYLKDVARRYDEKTLLDEIAAWPNTRVSRKVVKIAGINQVPALEVKTPIASRDDFQRFLDAFLNFLLWPHPKKHAWAHFQNVNPVINDDTISVRFFYNGNEHFFLIARETPAEGIAPLLVLEDVAPQELAERRNAGILTMDELLS